MKKRFILLFSVLAILLLTGCGNKEKTIDLKDNYEPKKAELVGLPVYSGAVLYRDYEVNVVEDEDSTYWCWDYSTTGSAREIVEFFKVELKKIGYKLEKENLPDDYLGFGLKTTDEVISISEKGKGKANTDKSYDEIGSDTPGRDYRITVNLDKWKN